MTVRFRRSVRLTVPVGEAFAWHERPGAFERLNPPWQPVELLECTDGIRTGSRVTLRVPLGPLGIRWRLEHRDFEPGRRFRDVQTRGPFAFWDHEHRFAADEDGNAILRDELSFGLPGGAAATRLLGPLIRRQLDRLFRYRHRVTRDDLAGHAACKGASKMKILVTGSTGLVGSALVPYLTSAGHHVRRVVRGSGAAGGDDVVWDPGAGRLDPADLEGADAVVHLAGENIADGRWTEAKKARIRDSRVDGTRLLSRALAACEHAPRVLVSASAIGYYGSRGDEVLEETSAPGDDFLAQVCRQWEAATEPARDRGVRVVNLRTGIVLSPRGGALAKMLTPFRLGLGGRIGDGRQFMSWIALDDLIGGIEHALTRDDLHGPVNAVAPRPVTNREFTRTLGRVLHRPTLFPMPAPMARLALGEMADALLLASTRVEPSRLRDSGYRFRFPDLEEALRHLLGKARDPA